MTFPAKICLFPAMGLLLGMSAPAAGSSCCRLLWPDFPGTVWAHGLCMLKGRRDDAAGKTKGKPSAGHP